MSGGRVLAVAIRVLRQLKHDHRTVGLILFVPSLLLVVTRYVMQNQQVSFHAFAPLLLGVFPLVVMFIVTSIAMLRERSSGTLDRLMTLPINRADIIFGYMLAFSVLAVAQVGLACVILFGIFDVTLVAGVGQVFVASILAAWLGTSLGLLASAFAHTEFQAVQFMPAFILPQLLVCGLLVPREQMALLLQWLANLMPLTYSVDALKQLIRSNSWSGNFAKDMFVVVGFVVVALVLGSLTIRRKEA